ncbi:MAG: hypothetical protein MUC31_08655 [Bacteroidales bacterium]|jgi:hypothetical protein|nr:hypothetical protein [Bacteroidales bacterium]
MQRILIMLIILAAVTISGQAQDKLKVGEVKNGKLVITSPEALNAFFLKKLGNSGSLSKDLQINAAPEGDRFLVFYAVTGNIDKISNIGVLLVRIKNEVFIVKSTPGKTLEVPGGGVSYEVTCIPEDCITCVPKIRWTGNWLPYVDCLCTSEGGGICRMQTKITIEINL